MDEDISGVFMGDEQIGLSILLNTEHHKFRHTFTLAHEYCHVLTDRGRTTVVSSAKTGKDLIEVRANAFAAAFLLPKAGVEAFFESLGKVGSTRSYLASTGAEPSAGEQRRPAAAVQIQLYDIVHLQHHYGVSWDAVVYRLQNLGLISKDECAELLEKKDEANLLSRAIKLETKASAEEKRFENRDFAARFFSLGVDAYRQEIISLKKLEELMEFIDIEPDRLKEILRKAGISEKAAAR
jgi:Zn-dependent peptidase ImmA (M78 family)